VHSFRPFDGQADFSLAADFPASSEGLWTKHALGRGLSRHQERPTKALQRGADGLRQEVWRTRSRVVADDRPRGLYGPGGLPMSPVSRLERLPARLHELIRKSAGLSLSPFALGPFSSRQLHLLSRFGGQSPH
jgi:hypothetical protein